MSPQGMGVAGPAGVASRAAEGRCRDALSKMSHSDPNIPILHFFGGNPMLEIVVKAFWHKIDIKIFFKGTIV